MLEIKGFIPNTMLDWEGMLASTLFLPRCNFRCPFCQNADLVLRPERLDTVPFSVVADYLHEREGWIEGVCITGGEPCLHEDLAILCEQIKRQGARVKLDTNGSLPDRLGDLLAAGLLDYVAMDVKAPIEAGPYRVASGVDGPGVIDRVTESIEILSGSAVEHEYRTTVVPMMHGPAEVAKIAEYLKGEERFVLQHFRPGDTLDPRFAELKPFTDEDMRAMLAQARKYIPGTVVRGAPAQA